MDPQDAATALTVHLQMLKELLRRADTEAGLLRLLFADIREEADTIQRLCDELTKTSPDEPKY